MNLCVTYKIQNKQLMCWVLGGIVETNSLVYTDSKWT